MNTLPPNPSEIRQKALELALQARRETLPESERAWLDATLRANPEFRDEVSAWDGFLLSALPSCPDLSDAARERLRLHARALSTPRAAQAAPRRANPIRLRSILAWLFVPSPQSRLSFATVLVGRALALYLGIMTVLAAQAIFSGKPTERGNGLPQTADRAPSGAPSTPASPR